MAVVGVVVVGGVLAVVGGVLAVVVVSGDGFEQPRRSPIFSKII